jgi:hypothetical protein
MEFLSYIIFGNNTCMDVRKVQTIVDWTTPTSIHDVQCFFAFANFYWRFNMNYFTIAPLFTDLTWKDQPFA